MRGGVRARGAALADTGGRRRGQPSRITARRYLRAACTPPELVAWYRDLDVDWRAMPPLAGGART
jgi:hypothetical protein